MYWRLLSVFEIERSQFVSHPFDLAYIDPTAGTIVFQAVIAGILGLFWRMTSFFRRRKPSERIKTSSAAPPDVTSDEVSTLGSSKGAS
jgi:hypothetical protein